MKRTVAAEQFYTSAELVSRCLDLLTCYVNLESFDLLLEPSAGAGAFLLRLPEATRLGIDILPMHNEVKQQDFFTWLPPAQANQVLTIGNPPFGQRACLAVKFLERAALFSSVIAFVLPRSFRKYTFLNRVPSYFHLLDCFDCDTFESIHGAPVNVKCVFQIWEKRADLRPKIQPRGSHIDFEMKHAHLSRTSAADFELLCRNYDFAIPQVGGVFKPKIPGTLRRGSYWFIKANAPGVHDSFECLDFSFLDGMNTAHKSLSKADIVAAYNAARGG